jgi:hypothetical protein
MQVFFLNEKPRDQDLHIKIRNGYLRDYLEETESESEVKILATTEYKHRKRQIPAPEYEMAEQDIAAFINIKWRFHEEQISAYLRVQQLFSTNNLFRTIKGRLW